MINLILKIIGNYLLVQAALILFILPFYLLYRRAHPASSKHNISRQMELFFETKYANWLVFFWAAGEALLWFVIPEFLLLLLIFMRVRRKRELLYWDIYGTAAGTLLAFVIHLPERLIASLPYVQPGMVDQVKHWYDVHGIFALLYQPFSGIPYKVFTHLAPDYHFFVLWFLILAVVVRISRYFIVYTMLNSMYPFLHRYVYRNYVKLFLVGSFIFSMLLLRVYSIYGAHYHVVGLLILRRPF